jgi:hypothetical protein
VALAALPLEMACATLATLSHAEAGTLLKEAPAAIAARVVDTMALMDAAKVRSGWGQGVWVWKAAASKAGPRQQQDWFLMCLQGGRAHPLANPQWRRAIYPRFSTLLNAKLVYTSPR